MRWSILIVADPSVCAARQIAVVLFPSWPGAHTYSLGATATGSSDRERGTFDLSDSGYRVVKIAGSGFGFAGIFGSRDVLHKRSLPGLPSGIWAASRRQRERW